MALLATIMTPAEAAAMLIVPSAVTNVWQFLSGRSPLPLVRRLATMMIGVCVGTALGAGILVTARSEEHTSELQSLMRISYAVFCLKKKNKTPPQHLQQHQQRRKQTDISRIHQCQRMQST